MNALGTIPSARHTYSESPGAGKVFIPQEGEIIVDFEKLGAGITAGSPEVLNISSLQLIYCCETVGNPCLTYEQDCPFYIEA